MATKRAIEVRIAEAEARLRMLKMEKQLKELQQRRTEMKRESRRRR